MPFPNSKNGTAKFIFDLNSVTNRGEIPACVKENIKRVPNHCKISINFKK